MGRKRSKARADWPDYLQQRKKGSTVFYTYEGPAAPKAVYLGTDLAAAKKGVAIINGRRAPDAVQAVLNKIENPSATLLEHGIYLKQYYTDKRNKRGLPMAKDSLYEYKRIIDDIVEQLGPGRAVSTPGTADVARLLDGKPAWTSNKYRSIINVFFQHAIAKGHRRDNPAASTIKRDPVVERGRLSYEAFLKIRGAAPAWLVRAMDLALWSLQRENDLVLLQAAEHWQDGRLRLAQSKGQRHGTGRLAIKPGQHLLGAILACLNSPEREHRDYGLCPYLVHRVPLKNHQAPWKLHPMQINEDMLSRSFGELRDELGLYADLPPKRRPSFYEIKALGGDRYITELGWTEEQVQALMGHTTKRMTREYLDGHGVRYVEVASG